MYAYKSQHDPSLASSRPRKSLLGLYISWQSIHLCAWSPSSPWSALGASTAACRARQCSYYRGAQGVIMTLSPRVAWVRFAYPFCWTSESGEWSGDGESWASLLGAWLNRRAAGREAKVLLPLQPLHSAGDVLLQSTNRRGCPIEQGGVYVQYNTQGDL